MEHHYLCELVDGGLIVESFWIQETGELEVTSHLDLYDWPEGTWRITPEWSIEA